METKANNIPIFCLSNGSMNTHPENTLTRFINNIPPPIELPSKDNWCLAVESIGFSTNFSNILIPKNRNVPSIKIFPKKIFDLPLIDNYNYGNVHFFTGESLEIFFPNQKLGKLELKKFLENYKIKYIKFNCDNSENIFSIEYIPNNIEGYVILIHRSCVKTFGFPISHRRMINVSGEIYYYDVLCDYNKKIVGLKDWTNCLPSFVKIQCDEIDFQILNNSYTKDLISFHPNFNEKEDFYFLDFDYKQFVPLSNTTLEKISISLLNENDYYLPLVEGCATFIKLILKKMGSNYESFNVRLSSENSQNNTKNKNYNFTVELPQYYSFTEDWKVALTSINYPTEFLPLPISKDLRNIYTTKLGKTPNSFLLPNIDYTDKNIVSIINKFFNDITGGNCKMSLITENGIEKQTCDMLLKPHTAYILPKPIAAILGYSNEKNTSPDINEHSYYVGLMNQSQTDDLLIKFTENINIASLKPQYLMVYADFIEPSIVGGTHQKLLKVLPISKNYKRAYKIDEFSHLEYHKIENTELNKIEINIRGHDGELANFKNNTNVFLNVLFSNKEQQ